MAKVVHYEYYDSSSWCRNPDRGFQVWMRHIDDTGFEESFAEALGEVTCKDCLITMERFGKAAKRQLTHLACKDEARAKDAWVNPTSRYQE